MTFVAEDRSIDTDETEKKKHTQTNKGLIEQQNKITNVV